MERFNGEILYVIASNHNHKKEIFKVKNISNNFVNCLDCKFTYFTGCPPVNLVGSCYNSGRYFIETKICNDL